MHARSGRYPLIDSLRAIAALTVLAAHAAFYSNLFSDTESLRPYLARLDVAVPVFFVVSGFLLYRPFVAARLRNEPQLSTGPYAWRRFLRIVPAYWVALTVTTIWLGLSGVFTPDGIVTYYGFGQIYSDGETARGGIFQAWTLCVEVAFYAFLPVWAFVIRRFKARGPRAILRNEAIGVAAIIVFSLAYKAWILSRAADPNHANADLSLLYLPAFLDQLGMGMALAVASLRPPPDEASDERAKGPARFLSRFPMAYWVAAAILFWVVCTRIGLDGNGGLNESTTAAQALTRHSLYAVIALLLVAPAVFGDQTRGFLRKHVLGNRALLYVGVVSYGLYLWHTAVLIQLERWGFSRESTLAWFLIGLVGGLILASLSYWCLERPVLSLKRWFPYKRELPGEAPPGEPVIQPVSRGAGP